MISTCCSYLIALRQHEYLPIRSRTQPTSDARAPGHLAHRALLDALGSA